MQRVIIAPAAVGRSAQARLTEREFRLVRLMSRGLAGKELAHELRLADATARAVVSRVTHKLGLRTSAQLPAFWQTMRSSGRWLLLNSEWTIVFERDLDPGLQIVLSPAERAIVGYILEGLANACIAAKRRSSVRTVANQVAAVFRKLGVMSRGELVAKIAAASAPELAESSRARAAGAAAP